MFFAMCGISSGSFLHGNPHFFASLLAVSIDFHVGVSDWVVGCGGVRCGCWIVPLKMFEGCVFRKTKMVEELYMLPVTWIIY